MKIIYLSIVIVLLDQVTKLLVKGFSIPFLNFNYDGMYYGQSIPIIGDFFRLTFIENPGMAFGFDPGISFKLPLTLFSLFASIGLIIYLYIIRNNRFSLRLSVALILGGAIGNLIDRTFYGVIFSYAPLFYGRVVDFFDFDFFNFTIFGINYDRWPIFNIADASVTIGVLILLFFYKNGKQNENIDEKEEETEQSISIEEENLNTENRTESIAILTESIDEQQNNNREEISNKSS